MLASEPAGGEEGEHHQPESDVRERTAGQAPAPAAGVLEGRPRVGDDTEQRRSDVNDRRHPAQAACDGRCDQDRRDCQGDAEDTTNALPGAAPAEEGGAAEKQREHHDQPEAHAVVEVGPHLRRLAPDLGDQRRRGAEEHHQPDQDGEQDPDHEEDGARHEGLVADLGRDLAPAVDQQADRHGEEEEHVEDQPAGDPEVDEGVDREVGQHAGAGQEGGVDHEQEGGARQHQVEAPEAAPAALQQHAVGQGQGREPGHQGGVLHRVPAPVAAPAEGLVGPVAAEHDGGAEAAQGQQHPRQRNLGPLVVTLHPERGDGKCERHRRRGVADEHDRRMDHHPRVLQQRVHALPVHRRQGCRQSLVEAERVLSDQQQDQRQQGQVVDHHDPRLVRARKLHQGQAEEHPPEDPQQEAALLSGPERGDQVVQRQHVV